MKWPLIKIPSIIYLEMISHSQKEWPNEACGILAGTDDEVRKIYPLENQEKSPYKFLISPLDQLKVLSDIEKSDLRMVGVYHSHPNTDPYPSKRDLEFAIYPDVLSVIISLKRKEKPKVYIFSFEDGNVKEVEYTIT
ncbi:MAG: M67 family metallopeptidase [Deltaproteobacteria bacterium]|nr:M67 family metallopeptidase [Deltaproteobacteria bacterium]